VQDGLLADLYVQKLEGEAVTPNLEARARELYKTDAKTFSVPEQVAVQHILVNLVGRTRETALAKAKEIHDEVVKSKEDFAVLAKRFSEDPDVRRNSGMLGPTALASFEPAFAAAVAGMKGKGEISAPVETKHGFHIIRFVLRKPASTVPFEEVRDKLIASERQKILTEQRARLISQIRESSTVVVHKDNVEALRSSFDLSRSREKPALPADKK
jgi:peptidyl-prolyl cis-trans isomerase C